MAPEVVIALAAVGFSSLTFIAAQVGARRTADKDYVISLERRLEKVEEDLKNCMDKRNALEQEQVLLLRKLVGLDPDSPIKMVSP